MRSEHAIGGALLLGAALLASGAARAQTSGETPLHAALGAPDALKLSGTFRVQLEALDGQFRPNTATADRLLTLRTTIAAEYDTGPVRLGAELWDARGYLEEANSSTGTGEVNALELVRAYVGIDLDAATTLDAGRLTLDIGSRRLISRQNFRDTTNAFTGVHLHRGSGTGDQLDVFWVMPQLRLPNDRAGIQANRVRVDRETTDLQLFGASYETPIGAGLRLEAYLYALAERDSPEVATTNRRFASPGLRVVRAPKARRLDLDVEITAQRGHARRTSSPADVIDRSVRAWGAHGEVGYAFARAWQPRLALVYDYGSGNHGSDVGRFDTLYGARRFEFGPTSLYGPVSRANSISPGARVEVKPNTRWDGFAMYRALWLDSATDAFGSTGVRDPSGRSGRFAGQQIEARARYWLVPRIVQVEGGGAILIKGRFLRTAPNAPADGDTHYGYAAVNVKF